MSTPPGSLVCGHIVKRSNCEGCHPTKFKYSKNPKGTPPGTKRK